MVGAGAPSGCSRAVGDSDGETTRFVLRGEYDVDGCTISDLDGADIDPPPDSSPLPLAHITRNGGAARCS